MHVSKITKYIPSNLIIINALKKITQKIKEPITFNMWRIKISTKISIIKI